MKERRKKKEKDKKNSTCANTNAKQTITTIITNLTRENQKNSLAIYFTKTYYEFPDSLSSIQWYPQEREREMFYLTTHSTHFIYGYMASDIWLRTTLIERKETRCRHIGYSYRLAARVLLYAQSNRQDNTYHGLCYTSRGALAGTRNSSVGGIHKFKPKEHHHHHNPPPQKKLNNKRIKK